MGYPLNYNTLLSRQVYYKVDKFPRRDVYRLYLVLKQLNAEHSVFFKKYLVSPLLNGKDMKKPMCKTNLTLRHRGLRLITMCHINSLLKI